MKVSKKYPGGNYPLHKICCSENPTFHREFKLQDWLEGDDVHLTPLHYLFINPNTDVDTIKTLLTSYQDGNNSEIQKRAAEWIENRWTKKDRNSYEYPLHERCRSDNPTFDREYTLQDWLEEDDIDLTPLHYIFTNPTVDEHTIQPILTAFERAYNGFEANLEEEFNVTTSLQSDAAQASLSKEVTSTSTKPIEGSDEVEVSEQKTPASERTPP
ncbi:predicted protein [Chaetoceros tenuissimus]|uniref:Uncharacterized protein n=1 Tax=Chaetoceros tenuissimus TaxID=426638 RepID=A0AAD3HB64_9STRA|nr:predicted protein [Chaetoceros tenuissimus]